MGRTVTFEPQAFQEFCAWQSVIFDQMASLTVTMAIQFVDLYGTSGSQPVSYKSQEAWSYGLQGKHRLIYQLTDQEIRVLSCRHRRK